MTRRTYRYRGRWNRRARNVMKIAARHGRWTLAIRCRSGSWALVHIKIREPLYTLTIPESS